MQPMRHKGLSIFFQFPILKRETSELINVKHYWPKMIAARVTGLSQAGGGRGHVSQFLAQQLTLSQLGGQIMPTTVLSALPDFQTLRRPMHTYVNCQTTYRRLKNRFKSKGFWPKYWVGFLTVRRNQFIRLATNLKLCGRYVHVFRFNVHAQNYEKHSTFKYSPFEIWFSGWAFRPIDNFNHWSKMHLNLFLLKFFREPKNFGNNFRRNLKFKSLIESKTQCNSHHV